MNAHDQLTRALTEKGERFAHQHSGDISMDSVLARAGEIRRGRRMRATMVMAAVVLAIAVPIGITVLGDDTPSRNKPLPSKPVDDSSITIDGLTNGDAPKTGYLSGNEFVDGDGSKTFDDAPGDPVSVARLTDGYLVARQDEEGNLVARFVPDSGEASRTWPINAGFAVSPKGNVGAFVQPDGTVVAVQDGGSRYFDLAKIPNETLEVVAAEGENCSEEVGCTVFVESNDDDPKVWAVSPNGKPTVVGGGLKSLAGVSDDRFAGIVSITDTGSCSEVQAADGKKIWATCDNRFVAFSPNGQRLLATGPYGDSMGDAGLTFLSAETGENELDLSTVQDAVITQMRWEDDEHVLAVVFEKGRWAVLRIDLYGDREYAAPPVQGTDDLMSPYVLPAD